MRRLAAVVLVISAIGCSKESKGISESQCKARAEAMASWSDGPPAGYPDERTALLARTPGRNLVPPIIDDGWRPIDESEPIYLTLEKGAVVVDGRTYSAGESGDLQQLNDAVTAGRSPVYVIAGADAPLALLEQVHAALQPRALRLIVRRPLAAFNEAHLAAFPRTPAHVRELIAKESVQRGGLAAVGAELRNAAAGCEGADEVLELIAMGGGIDVAGPGIAEALVACRCKVNDLDGLESLLAFVLMPRSDIGWLPLALSYDEDARSLALDEGASIGDLAGALASLPAAEQDGPLAYTTDPPPLPKEAIAEDEVEKLEPVDGVQPLEEPLPDTRLYYMHGGDDDDDSDLERDLDDIVEDVEGGVEGGVPGGVVGGVLGGAPPPPPPAPPSSEPQIVPQVALEQNRIAGDKQIVPPEDVKEAIRRQGNDRVVATVKMCVDADGHVDSVKMMKSSGYPAYDERLRAQMRRWRYRPFEVNGKAVPVCTAVTFIYTQS